MFTITLQTMYGRVEPTRIEMRRKRRDQANKETIQLLGSHALYKIILPDYTSLSKAEFVVKCEIHSTDLNTKKLILMLTSTSINQLSPRSFSNSDFIIVRFVPLYLHPCLPLLIWEMHFIYFN